MKKVRKTFYTVVCERGVVGIVEQDGFEVEIDGEKFNAYRDRHRDSAYIIDPQTGLALQTYEYDCEYDLPTEIEMIERAGEKLIEKKERLKKWREQKGKESYKLTVQMFKAYKKAEGLREKQKEAVRRELSGTKAAGE